MGTNRPGTAGKFNGKVGELVLSPWKGLHIARKKPGKSYKKPSIAQLEQRLRVGITSGLLKNLWEAINIGFPSNKKNMTNMNLAQQHGIKNAVTGSYPELTIDHSKIQISNGDLAQVYNPRISIISGTRNIKVTWQNPINLKLGVEEHDQVQLCLFTDRGSDPYTQLYRDIALRSDEEVTVKCAFNFAVLHVWMFLISADQKRASISRYLSIHALQDKQETG